MNTALALLLLWHLKQQQQQNGISLTTPLRGTSTFAFAAIPAIIGAIAGIAGSVSSIKSSVDEIHYDRADRSYEPKRKTYYRKNRNSKWRRY